MKKLNHTDPRSYFDMSQKEKREILEKATRETDYCRKHSLYHGQKYKSCTPDKRTVVMEGEEYGCYLSPKDCKKNCIKECHPSTPTEEGDKECMWNLNHCMTHANKGLCPTKEVGGHSQGQSVTYTSQPPTDQWFTCAKPNCRAGIFSLIPIKEKKVYCFYHQPTLEDINVPKTDKEPKQHMCVYDGCICIVDFGTFRCISKLWHYCNHQPKNVNKQINNVNQNVNQTKKGGGFEDWEKEFDEYWFVSKERTRGSTNAHRYEVKAFIRSLLASQKSQVVEVLEGLKLRHVFGSTTDIHVANRMEEEDRLRKKYNQALEGVKDAIQKISGGDK